MTKKILFLISAMFITSITLFAGANPENAFMFKRVLDTPYPKHSGTGSSDMVVADFNGDKKDDVLISGMQSISFVTLLYIQKGDGSGFEAPIKTEHGLPAMDKACVLKAADMDGDGDNDIVMYGRTGVAMQTALFKVFENNGKGVFTLAADLGSVLPDEDFEDTPGAWGKAAIGKDNKSDSEVKGLYNGQGWSKGVLEVVDLNKDGKLDIAFAGSKGIESGTDAAGQMIQRDWETSGVFLNNGGNKFTYLTATGYPQAGVPENAEIEPQRSFPGIAKVNRGCSASADFNGDGNIDIVVFGQANMGPKANGGIPESQRNGLPIVEMYTGKGDGTFNILKNTGLPALIDCSALPIDIDKDGKMDLIVMGNTGYTKDPAGGRVTKIFLGKGDGTFTVDVNQVYDKVPNSADWIVPMMSGDIGVGDIDGDGDLDLVVAGNSNDKSLYMYINEKGKFSIKALDRMKNGLGTNNVQGNGSADASTECDLYVGDYDKDGDVDIIINGRGGAFQLLAFSNLLIQ